MDKKGHFSKANDAKQFHSYSYSITSELWKSGRLNQARREAATNNRKLMEVLVAPQICRDHFHIHNYEAIVMGMLWCIYLQARRKRGAKPPNNTLKFVDFVSERGCKSQGHMNEDSNLYTVKVKVKVKVKLRFSAPSAGIAEIEQT